MAYIREYPTLPPTPLPREKVTKRRPEIGLSKQAKRFADKRQKTVQKKVSVSWYASPNRFYLITNFLQRYLANKTIQTTLTLRLLVLHYLHSLLKKNLQMAKVNWHILDASSHKTPKKLECYNNIQTRPQKVLPNQIVDLRTLRKITSLAAYSGIMLNYTLTSTTLSSSSLNESKKILWHVIIPWIDDDCFFFETM